MVVAFGRDTYGMTEVELQALGEQVRAGDLTSVLKVWEEDIKVSSFSPPPLLVLTYSTDASPISTDWNARAGALDSSPEAQV
jgi:hypothetical protein